MLFVCLDLVLFGVCLVAALSLGCLVFSCFTDCYLAFLFRCFVMACCRGFCIGAVFSLLMHFLVRFWVGCVLSLGFTVWFVCFYNLI